MKMIVFVALALVAATVAAPSGLALEHPKIVRSDFDQLPEGPYTFVIETEDGIKRSETAELKTVTDEENKPRSILNVRGSYSYTNLDGTVETINYEADENGYRAEGPSVPKVPVARR